MNTRTAAIVLAAAGWAAGAAALEPVVINPDGVWCWYQDERALYYDDDTLLVGSITGAGAIQAAAYRHDAGTSTVFTLNDLYESDDHNVPSFLRRTDGRVIAFYTRHSRDDYMRYRVTASGGDVSAWSAESSFDAITDSQNVCYSNPFMLAGETNRIYLFYRGVGYNPTFVYSDDQGSTWSMPQRFIVSPGERPYVKYCSDGSNTIHFIFTEAHPDEYTGTSIYHLYYRDGGLYRSDGTYLTNLVGGTVTPSQATRIYDGASAPTGEAWTWDVHLDPEGRPVTGYSTYAARNPDDYRYRYARWDGAQWVDTEVARAGTRLYNGQASYCGGIAIDPDDVSTIYVSSDVDLQTGAPNPSGKYEIHRGQTEDDGATWRWVNLTPNAAVDQLRPIVPANHPNTTCVLWYRGRYTSYTDYDTEVVGLFTDAEITPPPSVSIVRPAEASAAVAEAEGRLILEAAAESGGSTNPLVLAWTQLGGPGLVDFEAPGALTTAAVFPTAGTYTVQFLAAEGIQTTAVTRAIEIGAGPAPALPAAGLLAHYPLDETVGTNAFDATPNGYDATLAGAGTWTNGVDGGGLWFDGSSAVLDAGTAMPINGATQLTVSLWVRLDTTGGDDFLAGKSNWTSPSECFMLWRDADTFTARRKNTLTAMVGNYRLEGADGALNDTGWHHVAVTFKGGDAEGLRLYIDGVEDPYSPLDMTSVPALPSSDKPFTMGNAANLQATTWLNGTLDDVRVYDRALTTQEIGALVDRRNRAPSVDAGSDLVFIWPSAASLAGSVTDDGKPAAGAMATAWSTAEGPANAVFNPPGQAAASATFPTNGLYRLRLVADDGAIRAFDDCWVMADLDTDGDGQGNLADADDDGDGSPDVDEAIAGTDPLDFSSYFRVADFAAAPVHLEVQAAAGRMYTLEYRDSLVEGPDWQSLYVTNAAESAVLAIPIDPSVPERFYRLRVELAAP